MNGGRSSGAKQGQQGQGSLPKLGPKSNLMNGNRPSSGGKPPKCPMGTNCHGQGSGY